MSGLPAPAEAPCASCPYRLDVPSGIWDRSEYEKLPAYGGETYDQPTQLFMCHQQDGTLCSGWLTAHDPRHLLALRLHPVDPAAYERQTRVECFATGREARDHGCLELDHPGAEAERAMARLARKRGTP